MQHVSYAPAFCALSYNIGVIKFEYLSYGAKSEEQNLGKEKFGHKNTIFISILVTLSIRLLLLNIHNFMGEYLRLAEVKWLKKGLPGVKPL